MNLRPRRPQSLPPSLFLVVLPLIALLLSFRIVIDTAHAMPLATLNVTLTSPVSNAIYGTRQPIPVSASVTDSTPNAIITRVEFYSSANGGSPNLIGTSTSAPYGITWFAQQPGTYALTAKAFDSAGNVAVSAPVSIGVAVSDPLPAPVVSLTSPANGATFTAPATIVIAASIAPQHNPIIKVDFFNGSTLLGTATSAPYTFTWSNVPAGTYTLTATATDSFNLTGTSAPVTITVTAPGGTCAVTYTLTNQWPGGLTANITITNTGKASINGWTLAFTFPGDQKITNLWNGSYTQSGKQVAITNAAWNATIPPGGTTSVGFNGTWTNNDTNPTTFTLNGQTCS